MPPHLRIPLDPTVPQRHSDSPLPAIQKQTNGSFRYTAKLAASAENERMVLQGTFGARDTHGSAIPFQRSRREALATFPPVLIFRLESRCSACAARPILVFGTQALARAEPQGHPA